MGFEEKLDGLKTLLSDAFSEIADLRAENEYLRDKLSAKSNDLAVAQSKLQNYKEMNFLENTPDEEIDSGGNSIFGKISLDSKKEDLLTCSYHNQQIILGEEASSGSDADKHDEWAGRY